MNGYKTLDTLSRRTRRQTLMKIGTRTSKEENTSILFHLSSCRATVLVKQVTRDRTVHSRLHPRFDQFRSITSTSFSSLSTLLNARYNIIIIHKWRATLFHSDMEIFLDLSKLRVVSKHLLFLVVRPFPFSYMRSD